MIAIVLTMSYGFSILLLSAFSPDNYCTNTSNDPKLTWRALWHGCLSLNELGDFLAGASAPLAFIWLVAAVFVQSHELKEQRNEIKLTREEFKLNRGVMTAQAEEARRQAEYIGQQTEFLKAEQKERDGARKTREFEGALEVLVSIWILHPTVLNFLENDKVILGVTISEKNLALYSSNTEKIQWIGGVLIQNNLVEEVGKINVSIEMDTDDPVGYMKIFGILNFLRAIYDGLPTETQMAYDSAHLSEQLLVFNNIHKRLNNVPSKGLEQVQVYRHNYGKPSTGF